MTKNTVSLLAPPMLGRRIARNCIVLVSLVSAGAVLAEDLPRRKPGLWETTMGAAQMKGVSAQQCIDEKTDAEMFKRGLANKDSKCSQYSAKRTGSGFEFDSVCKQGDATTTSHGVITGDFNSQYKMELTSRRTPPLNGQGDFSTTISARYLGPCSADMRPGDMKINGMVINPNGASTGLPPQQAEQMRKAMEGMHRQRRQN